jgi:hypothetical protein
VPTHPHIQRYLDKVKARSSRHRYHVVRPSLDQYRRVPFATWAKRVNDESDVLLDFSSRQPIRIRLHTRGLDISSGHVHLGWHFLDKNSQRVACDSGYEALFVAYLKLKAIPFEYHRWKFSRGPTLLKSKRSPRILTSGAGFRSRMTQSIQEYGFGYTPDFYLPATNEFTELKGWPAERIQDEAVRYLKRNGYHIRVLEWKHIRQLLQLPFRSYNTCLYRAKKDSKHPSYAFANTRWVKERLCEIPARRLGFAQRNPT